MRIPSARVLLISKCKYKIEHQVTDHCHNFHHLIYVTGGCGSLTIRGRRFDMRPQDLYIISPGFNHHFQSDTSKPLCTIEVKVWVHDPQLESHLEMMSPKIEISKMKIRMILDMMLDEATYCRPQYREMINIHFIELIMNLLRLCRSGEGMPASSCHSDTWADSLKDREERNDDPAVLALRYFQEHYNQKIMLKELAQQLLVSQAHLCRVFTERYAMSPMQYLNDLRIRKTKELLVNTDLSITEIAEKAGFQSVHYFSRRFAAMENMSPLQYRHMKQEIVELQVDEQYQIIDHHIVRQR